MTCQRCYQGSPASDGGPDGPADGCDCERKVIRFRLDSATAVEARAFELAIFNKLCWANRHSIHTNRGMAVRGASLLLHWWAVGHDPARALRNRKVGER